MGDQDVGGFVVKGHQIAGKEVCGISRTTKDGETQAE